MSCLSNILQRCNASTQSCSALREKVKPLTNVVDSLIEDPDLDLHYSYELGMLQEFTRLTNAINNCSESITSYVEKVIQNAQSQGVADKPLSGLLETFSYRVNNIANNIFDLSKAFAGESVAGLFSLAKTLADRLLGVEDSSNKGTRGADPSDTRRHIDNSIYCYQPVDSALNWALQSFTTSDQESPPRELFTDIVQGLYGLIDDRNKKPESTLTLDLEHERFFQAADLMIKKIAQLWCDFNLNFINFFDCADEIHEPTIRKIAKVVGYKSEESKSPIATLEAVRDLVAKETKNISAVDLALDYDWRLTNKSVDYLLHNVS